MAFEPIGTDEQLTTGYKPEDHDAPLIRGCMVFAVVSLVTFGLLMWPFLDVRELFQYNALIRALWVASIPAAIWGVVWSRIGSVPGASAFVAGTLLAGVFVYIRVRQVIIFAGQSGSPPTEYPDSWNLFIPIVWVVGSFVLAGIAVPWRAISVASTMKPEQDEQSP